MEPQGKETERSGFVEEPRNMANHLAIYSFAQSLRNYLQQSHSAFTPTLPAAVFEVLSSGRFSTIAETIQDPSVTIYLHRMTINNHLRNTRVGPAVGPLGLDLHFLLTVWSNDVEAEYTLMGWAMRQLHHHAYLDRSSLSADAKWAADEVVNLSPAELSSEEMARIWEASHRGYRLSYPFIARVVRLAIEQDDALPVVATRFTLTESPTA
jgi:hypothetical protein